MPTDSEEIARRIDEMEIKMTLLEQANEEMSDVIIAQQAAIDTLSLQLEQAKAQMEKLGEQVEQDNSPPPHY